MSANNEPYFHETAKVGPNKNEIVTLLKEKIKLAAKKENINFSVWIKDGFIHVATTNNPVAQRVTI